MNRESQRGFESGPSSSSSSSRSSRRSDNMDRARDMLIGALDRVIQLAGASGSSQNGSMSTQMLPHNDNNGSVRPVDTTIEEHRRLFAGYRRATPHNFEPPKASVTSSQVCGRSYKGKGRRRLMSSAAARRPLRTIYWKKCCICLKSMHQEQKPSAVERMGLAKMGLGLAELTFDHDGDAEHIHSVLVGQFPQLAGNMRWIHFATTE